MLKQVWRAFNPVRLWQAQDQLLIECAANLALQGGEEERGRRSRPRNPDEKAVK
jgi:hypothetical protein